ncbi:MAG: dUTP pyrophosphatase [Epulopiscium sp. Nele67-Bin002]|nr:MAG: dUTP pyrophosphatase [Epulopiscium sp. Nuni2H_MBin001]OON91414.1 MAG: dUTP pyrophosphatase [Epulopiscium sp. Nele67-Bin002]OON92419.1 MAG: dUTP pyrophosphatase [Epulopiscium sp. Nele67-Bin001]
MNKDRLAIYFARVNPEAIIPSKRDEDAGFDIYPCFDEDYIMVMPNETKHIPTGIASAFNDNYMAILRERSSTGSKGIGLRAGVIDSGYRGEWILVITNHNNVPLVIAKNPDAVPLYLRDGIFYDYNKALAQCLFLEMPRVITEEMTYDKLQQFTSLRGMQGFGESGK